LPAILAIGIITSYEDVRFGKIRNKWVILALLYAFAMYSALILFYMSKGGISEGYLMELGTNFLFSLIIGFGLWYMAIWSAGDGKLFIAYSALIPLSAYSRGYQKWVPSSMLLINVFMLGLIAMIAIMLFKTKTKDIKKVSLGFLKDFFKPKQLIDSIVHLFAIFWIVEILLNLAGLGSSYFLKIVLTIVAISIMQNKLKNKAFYLMILISLLRFFIDKSVYSISFVVNFIILILIWRFVRSFLKGSLSKLGQELFSKEVNVSKLKPGILLSETIVKKDLKEINQKKQKALKAIKYKGSYYIRRSKSHMGGESFIDEEPEGLTDKQIDILKDIGIKKVRVTQTIAFAPFMFLGTILTLVSNGNILILIRALF